MAALTDKQKRFCEEYLIDLNATQAYQRAGYHVGARVAAANANRLLKKPEAAAYIQARQAELRACTAITQERVLRELAAVAFANAADFARVVEKPAQRPATGKPAAVPPDESPKTYQDIELTNTSELTEEKKKALAGIKYGKHGIVVEPYNKLKALELLGKHLGMFTQQKENSGSEVTIVDDV